MCRNSCLGNLNSRQIYVIFTLESSAGDIFGRITVELRICACPGRDRRQDESALVDDTKLKVAKRSQTATESATASKVRKSDDDDDQWFTLRVSMLDGMVLYTACMKPVYATCVQILFFCQHC